VHAAEQTRDEALIARAQRGDSAAFRDLVDRWYAQIYRWAVGHTGDPDDADDVTQQVLVRLHLQLGRFRGAARFSTWLYQITRNAARDVHRRRARRLRAMDRMQRLADARAPAPSADPAAELELRETLDAARAALARLPDRQREVFDLVELQGYGAHEAATLLGVSPATARTHLFRARRAVRAAMLGIGFETSGETA
jgi:RNA polymerase sigma-70 factor (ECF subfamily)